MNLDEIKHRLAEIFPTADYFAEMGSGQDFNFGLPPNTYVLETQIRELKKLGLVINQINYTYKKPGMRNHLHIWLMKIQKWDEDFK